MARKDVGNHRHMKRPGPPAKLPKALAHETVRARAIVRNDVTTRERLGTDGASGPAKDHLRPPASENDRLLNDAIASAQQALRASWNENGSWRVQCDAGVVTTATVTVVLHFIGQIDAATSAGITGYLAGEQRPDGGFPSYPDGDKSDLSTTAICYAALVAIDAKEGQVAKGALRFIMSEGGRDQLGRLARGGDLAALMMAMVGEFSVDDLPRASPLFEAMPGAELVLERRFAYLIPFRILVTEVLAEYLRTGASSAGVPNLPTMEEVARWPEMLRGSLTDAAGRARLLAHDSRTRAGRAADGVPKVLRGTGRFIAETFGKTIDAVARDRKSVKEAVKNMPGRAWEFAKASASQLGGTLPEPSEIGARVKRGVEGLRCDVYLKRFRNADGSWLYGDAIHTSLALAALHCLGADSTDAAFQEGLAWLSDQRRQLDAGMVRYDVFPTDVWPTAFALRALLSSGTSPTDPVVARAAEWLIAAERKGTWAFQQGNTSTPDADDAAVAMAALALLSAELAAAGDSGSPTLRKACGDAITAAQKRLLATQNGDGGWASYQPGLPSKPPGGRFMTLPPRAPGATTHDQLELLRHPPPELGDPATEDVTGRVLFALGRSGLTADESANVRRAISFLEGQLDPNHGWWGRWVVNYLAATSWVLRGLRAVDVERTSWIDSALDFLRGRQNKDGGWAESVVSYREPTTAGRDDAACGSNPCLTGLVVSALIEWGEAHSPAVQDGIKFLLGHFAESRAAGTAWRVPDSDTLHTLFPPTLFYTLPQTELQLPLEALGLYRRELGELPVSATGPKGRRGAGPALVDAGRIVVGQPAQASNEEVSLDQLQRFGDDKADRIVARLFEKGQAPLMNQIFEKLVQNQDIPPSRDFPGVDDALWEFFSDTKPPGWVDEGMLSIADQLFVRAGFGVPLVLFCSSLPQCYANADGARVLMATGAIPTNPRRRIVETAQLVFDVAETGGMLLKTGRGVRTAQKVRLLHAVIRKLVTDARPPVERAPGTVPLNQMQLVGTLMTFSVVVIEGLRVLGFEVQQNEAEAWHHLWKVVGSFLGVSLLPETFAEGERVFQSIRDRYWARSDEGTALTNATLRLMKDLIPGDEFDGLGPTLVRRLAGPRCADLLEVPLSDDLTSLIVKTLPVLARIGGGVAASSPVASSLGRTLQGLAFQAMQSLAEQERQGKRVKFMVPDSLKTGWDLNLQRSLRSS